MHQAPCRAAAPLVQRSMPALLQTAAAAARSGYCATRPLLADHRHRLQGSAAGTSILAIAGTLDLSQKPVLMVSHLEVRWASITCRSLCSTSSHPQILVNVRIVEPLQRLSLRSMRWKGTVDVGAVFG